MGSNKLINWLFETNAVRVCPENKPFWYTSCKIGPYYINTHFLYGSEAKANELLKVIDVCKEDKVNCSEVIMELVSVNYHKDAIFKGLIDTMCDYIKDKIGLANIDYISGGERRDWFFSFMIAKLLDKPHITVFKDLSVMLYKDGVSESLNNIEGAKVLHVADIITEASSYVRAWIPAIEAIGGQLKYSLVVVDRLQGGGEKLAAANVESHALVNVDKTMFDLALENKHITSLQHDMLMKYLDNPHDTMREFLLSNPSFLKEALEADKRTAERAKTCIEEDLYSLKQV